MKTLFRIIVWAALILLFIWLLTGCMQVIVEKPDGTKYKLNTFLYKLDVDKITGEIITVEKWRGKTDEVKAVTPYGIVEVK